MLHLTLKVHNSIDEIDSRQWDALAVEHSVFLSHRFLSALEANGCVCVDTGWQPYHLTFYHDDKLVAAAPGYLKTHSYGEYVFDHAWANAYHQHGLEYYPKLVIGVPFTPVTGPRLLHAPHLDHQQLLPAVCQSIQTLCERQKLSSAHWLFTEETLSSALARQGFMQRRSVQFQWFNREYRDFDHFLQGFTSRKRKSIRKERNKIAIQGIRIERLSGNALTRQHMDIFYQCYRATYLKRSGHSGYLNQAFFTELHQNMADNMMLVLAWQGDIPIASALFFHQQSALYGRYWGALQEADGLHFECCYYQGIEFAIEHKINLFNPGTQGEHKILRGFEPSYCYSNHYLQDPRFAEAVERFLRQENEGLALYKADAESLLPYRQE